ncbi:hypothetical protein EB796_006352 [Bugula neritina]|uniref:Coiled-coil domain-containing protein 181 n=1 Tax=Bugula neritina TaxID=10212 RepID=A0A7J7KAQ5_BUGNE|nr:hypothetical protein EB796_006352 [Bugula neritina]
MLQDKELTSVYEPAPYSEEDDPDFANDSVDNFTPDNTESNDNLQQSNSQNSGVEENGSHSPDREDEGGLSNKKRPSYQNQQLGNSDQKEEKVLVELNGKFELISVKEYEAMGIVGLIPQKVHQTYSQNQRNSRPKSSVESAFQWWLETKKENQSNATAADKQKKEEEERARREENEAAFEAWCEAKKEQHKRQRLLQNREQKERDDAYIIHSRDECDKAFKQWLRNKRQEQNMYYSLSATKNKPKKKKPRSRTSHSSGSSLNRKPDWSSKTR